MPRVLWLHAAIDPVESGELRRLGVPAVGLEDETWACDLAPAALAGCAATPDIVVAPLRAAAALRLVRNGATCEVVVEVDSRTALARADSAAVLHGLANRISGVVARGPRAAAWAIRLVGAHLPVWLIPDPAVRMLELAATAVRFGLPAFPDDAPELPDELDLWFAEPGDHVEAPEVGALAKAWRTPDPRRFVVAPPTVRAWLAQAGVSAQMLRWSPFTLQACLSRAEQTLFFGTEGYGTCRRRVTALRSGAPASPPSTPSPATFEPAQMVAGWREVLETVRPGRRRSSAAQAFPVPVRLMVFLDLIQDLDPLLPILDDLSRREGVELKIVVTNWLQRRSPRVAAELRARGLAFEIVDRVPVAEGAAPSLAGVDGVLGVAESSHPAHARTRALFERARDALIPTFALQHGVENVGLHPMAGEDDANLVADHLFVWCPPGAMPESVPAQLQPRLVHVGRPRPTLPDLGHLAGAFAAFDSVIAVFENLHWKRYHDDWRRRFLADCTDLALADPSRAVILKPHHAGLWTVKNRHQIPQWPPNLIVADPTDPFWEPFTAAALMSLAEAVITTPSTVALDAAQAGKPVAVAAYGLELPAYAPLFMLQNLHDWRGFLAQAGSIEDARRRATFLARTLQDGEAARACAEHMVRIARARRDVRETRLYASRAAG